MIEAGTILENRYLVQKRVGEGGMGTVYLASDQRFDSPVAIKETLFNDPDLKRAFEREAQLLNGLRHPALPRVTDHFVEDSRQFIVMEYIAGEDLSEMLRRKTGFPVQNVLHWADQLLDALEYLHAQNPPVIHRDIKPQNLKLTPRGQIILLDFGLAKGKPGDTSRLSLAKSIFGYSRSYSPLEQIQGTGTDPRSDLYSLAATLYHLLTGKPPVDALTRATKVLNGEPDPLVPIGAFNGEVPIDVIQILEQALALNANVRPVSAATMRQELRRVATDQTLINSGQFDFSAKRFDAPANIAVNSTSLAQPIDTNVSSEGSAPIAINLAPDVELTKVAEIESKNSFGQNRSTGQETLQDLPAQGEILTTNEDSASNTSFLAVSTVADAPRVRNRLSEKRQSPSWIKSAGIAAALILGGGSLAAWYATTAPDSGQNNNQTALTTNVSANKNSEFVNANNKAAASASSSTNAPVQNSLPTPTASGTVKTSEPSAKSAANNSSIESKENREIAGETEAPRSRSNSGGNNNSSVMIVKSAPQTRSSSKNKTETDDSDDQEEAPPASGGDGSSIEIRDLRDMPAEERDRIIDDLNRRKAQAERREEKLERRARRGNSRRNGQKLPTILGAPPRED